MNNKHKLIPKRRFKEFENADAWEQRKLGDIADRFDNLRVPISAADRIPGETPYYGANGIQDYVDGYTHDGEFLLVAEDGANDLEDYPVNYVNGKIWVNNHAHVIQSKSAISINSFLMYAIKQIKMNQFIVGGSRAKLNSEVMMSLPITIPDIKEQLFIGDYFQEIDNLIILHQRKLNKLAEIKSAYLSELFPVPGELKPKRRFAGYIDDWEQYEFADLLDKEDGIRRGPFGSALKKEYFVSKSDYVVYEQQNAIYDRFDTRYYITREKYEELHKFILEPEDFILSGAGTVGRISRVPKNIKKGVFNQALIRIKIADKIMDPDFFLQWVRSDSMQKKLTYGNPASAIVNLVPIDEIKKWKVIVPSLDEQVKIGNLLNKLDEAINSQNRKIEKLQNLKESYLNEMFV